MTEPTKITALDDWPFLVRGPLWLADAEGNEFRVERETVEPCRQNALSQRAVKLAVQRSRGRAVQRDHHGCRRYTLGHPASSFFSGDWHP